MAPRNRTNIEKEGVQDLEPGKSIAPPFLTKTHLLVEDSTTDDIISWNSEGTGFVVWKPTELARDLLPTIFKHCNFSSFVRQLNTYGFRKIVPGRWEFYNEKFQRDKHDLLLEIKRRKTWASTKTPASTSSTPEINNRGLNLNSPLMDSDEDRESLLTSSTEYDSLCEENARLRGDNEVLCLELQRMKNKCKELLDLVSACVDRNEEEEEEEKERPKLFGVRLELAPEQRKRKRSRVVAEEILKNTNFLKIVAPMQAKMHA